MATSRLRAAARAAAPIAVLTSLVLAQPGTAEAVPTVRTGPHRMVPARTVHAGRTWVVKATTRLSRLTIEPGASVIAPDGYSLTLTRNGVETAA